MKRLRQGHLSSIVCFIVYSERFSNHMFLFFRLHTLQDFLESHLSANDFRRVRPYNRNTLGEDLNKFNYAFDLSYLFVPAFLYACIIAIHEMEYNQKHRKGWKLYMYLSKCPFDIKRSFFFTTSRKLAYILAEKRNCACIKNKFSIILKSIYA